MIPAKTMTPLKASKQTSKIKNKLHNSSTFFKVSLKTNNKALAVALGAQKERSRLLEREIVYLHKQVEAQCFELATRKYKERKLVLILKNLYSNTLQHFDMVAELFSDFDLSTLSQDNGTLFCKINKENVAVERQTDELPPQPEVELLCPSKYIRADLADQTMNGNDFCIQSEPVKSTDACKDNADVEKWDLSQCPQALQTGPCRPPSMSSQSGFDMKSLPCPLNSQSSSLLNTCDGSKPSSTDGVNICGSDMNTEPEQSNKQEKTVLLDTTMEMTQSDAAEIVIVESKAKMKTGDSSKTKCKKNKEKASLLNMTENPQVKKSVSEHAQEVRNRETVTHESPRKPSTNVLTSRIPKMTKSAKCRRSAKNKLKSTAQSQSKPCDIVLPDVDDYFTDPGNAFSLASESVKLPPENNAAENRVSTITCRRSRTKGRRVSSFTKKPFLTSPFPSLSSESSESDLEQLGREVQDIFQGKYETWKEQEKLEEVQFCADEITHPELDLKLLPSPSGSKAQSNNRTTAKSAGSQRPRCRGTFVVSVEDCPVLNSQSPEGCAAEQDMMPSTLAFHLEAEEPSVDVGVAHSQSNPHGHSDRGVVGKLHSSCKRPWLATQESEILPEDPGSKADNKELLLDQDPTTGTEFQKPKKSRREETVRSGKKKAKHRKESEDFLKDKNKNKKSKSSNKGVRSEDDTCYLQGPSDASPGRVTDGPGTSKEQRDEFRAADISDVFDHFCRSKTTKSKCRTDVKAKEPRVKSQLHAPTEARNTRETFVVCLGKTEDSVSLTNTRTSDVSDVDSHTVDTGDEGARQNVGDLLTDEMPPWLDMDVSTAHTDASSFLDSPPRETSARETTAIRESAAVTPENSAAGRVLTSLTNTILTPDSENPGRSRRRHGVVSYKEPALNSKIRRGDKFTDSMFLSSPVFKNGKKKKQKKTAAKTKLDGSILDN